MHKLLEVLEEKVDDKVAKIVPLVHDRLGYLLAAQHFQNGPYWVYIEGMLFGYRFERQQNGAGGGINRFL